jgi:hypothetical protein
MTEPVAPDKSELVAQARQLLEAARRSSGWTVEEMVKALGDLQPRGAETRRSWYDWQERPETISMLTGIAAMHMLGAQATVELIFRDQAAAAVDTPAVPMSALVAEIASLRDQVQGTVLPELEKQGQMLARLLADREVTEPVTDAGGEPGSESSGKQASAG